MPERTEKTVRKLYLRRLRPNKVESYLLQHDQIPAELEILYRQHGINSISSFLHGDRLCVMVEFNAEVYDKKARALDTHPMELAWQARMAQLLEPGGECLEFKEVYRLKSTQPV